MGTASVSDIMSRGREPIMQHGYYGETEKPYKQGGRHRNRWITCI